MADIAGIRFPNSGKTYCFKVADDLELRSGDKVVVESEMGISIGEVARLGCTTLGIKEDSLKPILRKVTEADLMQEVENEKVKQEAREYGVERINARGLDMKLLTTEVTLDRKRFIFYFVAESRVDFRELVKDLASKFRTRIELRQIGVRDAAKVIGGLGVCGRELCCKTWLKSFAPISIKMAKQQNLVLNTCKLSGLCGRLMCCLNYEYNKDEPVRKRKPRVAPEEQTQEATVVSPKKLTPPARKAPRPSVKEAVKPVSRPETTVDKADTKPKQKVDKRIEPKRADTAQGQKKPDNTDEKKRRRRRRRRGNKPQNKDGQTQGNAAEKSTSSPQQGQSAKPAEGNKPAGDDTSRKKRRRRWKKPGKKPETDK